MSLKNIKRFRLRAAWLLAPLYLVIARPTPTLLVVAFALCVLGLVIRGWAAGTIHKNVVLTTTGPYAHSRNPLYVGTFFLGLGGAVASGRWWFLLAFLAVFAYVYGETMKKEARNLEARFEDDYRRYARHVPLFLPRLTPWRVDAADETGFRADRYRGNKEYQAALGVVIGFLALAAKMMWW